MTITETIKKLQTILETEGDIRVTTFDLYTANEGWDFERQDLWVDAEPRVGYVEDDDYNDIEKVVVM